MITKVIERIFSKTPGTSSHIIKGPHELIKEKIEKFDINGNCIESTEIDIWLNKILEESGMGNEKITTYKYDKRNNVIEKEFINLPFNSSKSEYVNKYDKNGNLINYDVIYTSHRTGEDSHKFFGKCDFVYDSENRMVKSKEIGFDKDDFIHFEELINISYDNEGNINNKTIKTQNKGSNGSFYNYTERIHKFYFDDSEQRVEEIEEYRKSNKIKELYLDFKQVINKEQKLHFSRNNKEYDYKELFYYDKSRLIKKECFHPKVLRNEPTDFYEYKYIESDV